MSSSIEYNYHEALKEYFALKSRKTKSCVGCGRKNKSIFHYEDGVYNASCGNIKDPCGLNIKIKRSIDKNIYFVYHETCKMLEKIKQNIIELKSQYMFYFLKEDELLNEFKELKQQLESFTKMLEELNRLQRSSETESNTNQLANLIQESKEKYNRYLQTNNKNELRESIEDIINKVLPFIETEHKLRYVYMEMEDETISLYNKQTSSSLVRKPHAKLFYNTHSPEVIQFKLK